MNLVFILMVVVMGHLAASFVMANEVIKMSKEVDSLSDRLNSVATKLAEEKAKNEYQRAELQRLKLIVDEIPVEEFIERNKREEAYFEGIQNIFNYGGTVQKLNLEGLKND